MTDSPVVTNASPLIYLALVGRFHLLHQLFRAVYLPEAVYAEVVIAGSNHAGAKETRNAIDAGWLLQVSVQNQLAVENLLDDLHRGEAEAIVLAREIRVTRVLLDDRAARRKGQLAGLEVTGTVGVLLLARQMGIVTSIRRELEMLMESNFRFSHTIYQRLLQSEIDS